MPRDSVYVVPVPLVRRPALELVDVPQSIALHSTPIEAESAVLSAIMLEPSVLPEIAATLTPEHFSCDKHKRIFEAMLAVAARGEPTDITLVATQLRDVGRLEEIGGTPYLAQILDASPTVSHVAAHARIVIEKSIERRQVDVGRRLASGSINAATASAELEALAREGADLKQAAGNGPTAEEPLQGLPHLAAVALRGRDRILELAAKPVDYVWQDIATPGTITLLSALPGEGKTTLLFLLLAARATIGPPLTLLGRAVTPAPYGQHLVLIEGEHGEASASRKLVKSLAILGVDDAAIDRVIIIARKSVLIGSPEWLDIVALVRAGLVSDIAIDTIARVAPADPDSEREQVAIFAAVAAAIEAAPKAVQPPSVWAAAHNRKNGTGDSLADVSGSAQRTGQADSVLLLKAERVDGKVISTKVTFAKLREDPDDYPEPVDFAIVKTANGLELSCEFGARTQTDDRPLEQRIITALATGPKTKSALSKLLHRSKDDLEEPITNLFGARQIKEATITIRGRNYQGFALK